LIVYSFKPEEKYILTFAPEKGPFDLQGYTHFPVQMVFKGSDIIKFVEILKKNGLNVDPQGACDGIEKT